METVSAEEAAKDLLKLMTLARQERRQYRIVGEEETVVMLSEETYQDLIVTLELLATPGLMKGLTLYKDTSPSLLNQ
jgi:antitoxin YefM